MDSFVHIVKDINVWCTDGMYSEDGLSSGGEFYDDNVEFRRPAPDIVIKSVPIVPSQQASV